MERAHLAEFLLGSKLIPKLTPKLSKIIGIPLIKFKMMKGSNDY